MQTQALAAAGGRGGLRVLPALLLSLAACLGAAPAHAADPAPEAATGWRDKPPVVATRHLVAAAHPLAAAAGNDILAAGGSAVDAAIAVQMVLNLVEPQSSGIGGGAFMLHWDAARASLLGYDGRETAPAAARPDRFLDADGTPLPFFDAVVGGASVGVPGLLRMLEAAHRRHGALPWADLFAPAIRLAEDGFLLSARLHGLLSVERHLVRDAAARAYFYQSDGTPKPAGTILRNPGLAATLRRIAADGADALYSGELAERVVAAVRAAPGGDLSAEDLAGYRPVERPPLCRPYRQWRVCGMPPPTSGGIGVLQMLGVLERFDLPALAPLSVSAAHLLAEAGKLAFADRDRYVADPDFVTVPTAALLDDAYLEGRADLIREDAAMGRAAPGDLPERHGLADDAAPDRPATTHLSIVDAQGNAVAMTSSIENAFGARLMVAGFLLNNQLTDFSFRPDHDGVPVANRVGPGKRPRSSMAPTMAFAPDGSLRLVTGSSGGSRIIGYVAGTVVAVLDWNLDPQAAAALPHVLNRNGPTELERGTAAVALRPALEALGHRVDTPETTSGTHTIVVGPARSLGGADPRREGAAAGE